jgi:hypothetical protein
MQEKESNMAKGAMTKSPKTGGRVYAGGSKNFDERTGKYTSPPPSATRVSPGVYRAPSGQLVRSLQQPMAQPSQRPSATLPQARPQMAPPLTQNQVGQVPAGFESAMRDAMTGIAQGAGSSFTPKGPASLDMQKPWMNQGPTNIGAPYRSQSMPQQQQLDLSQISNMSGEQIQQYINQLQQAQQAQQMQPAPQFNPSMYQSRQG